MGAKELKQLHSFCAGGYPINMQTELYNGTAWTEVNNVNTARRSMQLFGTQTAAISFWWYILESSALTKVGMVLLGLKLEI